MVFAELSPEYVLQQLYWRYAVKKFDPNRIIPEREWAVLEQSLVLAPSSFGIQPWKFVVVLDPDIRQQLVAHSWGQTQVVDASHLVVLAVKQDVSALDVDRFVQRMAEVRQTPVDHLQGYANTVKGFLDQPPYPLELNAWSTRQVYIALGQLMTCAAMLDIDTCPMEGIAPDQYDEVLGLSAQGYQTVVVCPVGYRSAEDNYAQLPKVRYPVEQVVEYIGNR